MRKHIQLLDTMPERSLQHSPIDAPHFVEGIAPRMDVQWLENEQYSWLVAGTIDVTPAYKAISRTVQEEIRKEYAKDNPSQAAHGDGEANLTRQDKKAIKENVVDALKQLRNSRAVVRDDWFWSVDSKTQKPHLRNKGQHSSEYNGERLITAVFFSPYK